MFRRFWDGIDPLPLPSFPDDRPNALKAANLATHVRTPYNILQRADDNWRSEHGHKLFGGNYLSPTPSVWANQQLGLVCISNLTNHIRTSFQKVSYLPTGQTDNTENRDDNDEFSLDGDYADDYKFYDGDFIDGLHELGVMDDGTSAVDAGCHVRAGSHTVELS